MNKRLSLMLIAALPIMLLSCKQCYECTKDEYCLSCIGTVGEITTPYNDCYATEQERATARETIEAGVQFAGGTVYCIESVSNQGSAEFCENKKNRDAELEQWKALGFTCTEQ